MLAYLLSRAVVVLATRIVDRHLRRKRDQGRGDDDGGRGGRGRGGGTDGDELVLAA